MLRKQTNTTHNSHKATSNCLIQATWPLNLHTQGLLHSQSLSMGLSMGHILCPCHALGAHTCISSTAVAKGGRSYSQSKGTIQLHTLALEQLSLRKGLPAHGTS